MIDVTGISEDDPPIFALRIVSDEPYGELKSWLDDRDEVRSVVLDLAGGADLLPDELDELSAVHEVTIRVIAGGTDEPAPA